MFKHKKKKTGCETPEYRCPTMPPVATPKEKEGKTMYGLNLYIPFEDLEAYIHEHINERYRDYTFLPIKAEINELDLSLDIKLISVSPIETDNCRYKLDLNKLPKEE